MNNRQIKAKCSSIYCLKIFPLEEAITTRELDSSGREINKIYCQLCGNSELIKEKDLNRNGSRKP